MIDITLKITGDVGGVSPFAVRVCKSGPSESCCQSVSLLSSTNETSKWRYNDLEFTVLSSIKNIEDNEVWIIFPAGRNLQRIYRPSSNSNTIMLTERCDQYCIMCSQPPKNKDYSFFAVYREAFELIDAKATIGISGGEPMLFKDELFELVESTLYHKPNISFHILTNGQHFEEADLPKLEAIAGGTLWGIPLYSHVPEIHDQIVGKPYAYESLLTGLNLLARSASNVELRTVVLRQNYPLFPLLAQFVSTNLQWINVWSIMQLEPIGFAKAGWIDKFVDTSVSFELIKVVLDVCEAKIMPVRLFNFPLCTVPISIRSFCVKSISDWKVKYIDSCGGCPSREGCSGVFEWYSDKYQYAKIGILFI